MELFKVDNATIVLSVAFVVAYTASKLLKPQSLVHPLLLGRQADVSRVRLPGESAVYRNYATGIMGRLPEKPKPEVKLVTDLVRDDHAASRMLWSKPITNAQLKERTAALGAGLVHVAGLTPRESTVLVLLDDGLEFLITELSLASHSIVSFTLTSLSLLTTTLEKHAPTAIIVAEPLLLQILEHIVDMKQSAHHTIIVVGDNKGSSLSHAQKTGIRVHRWEDLEQNGRMVQTPDIPSPESSDIVTISLYSDNKGEFRAAQLSHANIIAGVTAIRLLFPLANPLSPSDSILSVGSMSSAFGRAVAYTALYEGCNFTSLPRSPYPDEGEASTQTEEAQLLRACETSLPCPTLLFLEPNYLESLTASVMKAAGSSLLFGLAWRHKLSALRDGYITNTSFWDNMVFQGARRAALGKMEATLRAVVVSGGRLEAAALDPARIAFSVPVVCVHTHPLVCGPVLASHPLDLQSFPSDSEPHVSTAHVGPPATNVEAKLVGVLDTSIEKGGDPTGDLMIRGPSVGRPLPPPAVEEPEGWLSTGDQARVQPNGTFKI